MAGEKSAGDTLESNKWDAVLLEDEDENSKSERSEQSTSTKSSVYKTKISLTRHAFQAVLYVLLPTFLISVWIFTYYALQGVLKAFKVN